VRVVEHARRCLHAIGFLVLEAAVQVPFAQALYGVQEEHTTARVSLAMAR
jgi:hypothetical protein